MHRMPAIWISGAPGGLDRNSDFQKIHMGGILCIQMERYYFPEFKILVLFHLTALPAAQS